MEQPLEQSFASARRQILSAVSALDVQLMELSEALGMILVSDCVAQRDVPLRANAAMDGFAVRAADVATAAPGATVELPVAFEVAAGDSACQPLPVGCAARIMTGAAIPPGADAVVPFEQTDESHGRSDRGRIGVGQPIAVGANVRPAGEDVRAGAVVFTAGTELRPAHLGVAASLGLARLPVHRRPRVALLSTGDELAAPGAPVVPGQHYDTNGPTLNAAAREAGALPLPLGIAPDRPDQLEARLREAATEADLIVTSGGVSRGDYDRVKDVLAQLGRIAFWHVRMRPGRPLAFGELGGKPFVGLPGNPVAAAVCFEQFVRPAIRTMLGAVRVSRPEVEAVVRGFAQNPHGQRCFLRARVTRTGNDFVATLDPRQGSGILTSLADANALVVVPEDVSLVQEGDRLAVQLLDLDWEP